MNTVQQQDFIVAPEAGQTVHIGRNLTATFKIASEGTQGAVAVVEHTLAPGALGAALHRHEYEDEISYVLEGELTVQIGEAIITARPGAYVLKPRGIFHTFWNVGAETVRFVEMISPGGFERYFEELAPLVPPDAPPDIDGLMKLTQQYGLEFNLSSVPQLMERHGVTLG